MAESFITQCPHCGTSFRVRTEQLSVANGSVRCGACLQVFSARNHVVTTSIPAQKAAPAKRAATPIAAARAAAQAKPKPAAKPPSQSKFKAPSEEFKFAADDDDDAEFLFADGGSDDDYTFDDNAGDSLFDDDEQDDGFGELSDSFLNLSGQTGAHQQVNHFQRETQELSSESLEDPEEDADESWAESMLEEIEKEDKISTRKPAVFEAREVGQHRVEDKAPIEHSRSQKVVRDDFDSFSATSTGSFSASQSFSATQAIRASASQVVSRAASEEIELDFQTAEERQYRLRPLGWVAVALLALVLLMQLAWMARDTYARMDQWRGLYQSVCNLVGCTLPEQVDLDSVRTAITIRDHKDPNMTDVRVVDVVLTNKAPFKQPFPAMVLRYTDVNGKAVADQRFIPQEYLKGELTGEKLMPINTRIYISFAIRTPPRNAVNYQLTLETVN